MEPASFAPTEEVRAGAELKLHIKLLRVFRGGAEVEVEEKALRVDGICDEQDSVAPESAELVCTEKCDFRGEGRSLLVFLANTNFCLRMKFSLLSLEA